MTLYTMKYAPKNLSQVFGQPLAVSQLKDFIINHTQQKQKAALLVGPLGCGKTSSVYALAQELQYEVLEINSSDLRNQEAIQSFLGAALGQQSLFFTPKIVLIDEVDNVSGVKDRGSIPAIVKAVERAHFPVVLTANDVGDSKFKALKKACKIIEYHKLQYKSIAHGLQWVCEQENITFEEKALNSLARQVDGDMRAALLDLQICAIQGKISFDDVTILSDRKRQDTILNALTIIFKSSTIENTIGVLDNIDVDLEQVMFWVDHNLPKEYLTAGSLAKAYEYLARADVFQGRIRRWQHWRFLVYISSLLTAGISSAKEERNPNFVTYQPTLRFLRMWQAKMKNAKKKEIAVKLAAATHTSSRVALEQIPFLEVLCKYHAGVEIAEELDLSRDELEWLEK